MIEIRPARPEDLPQLRKVALDTFIEKFAEFNTSENMESYLREAYHPETLVNELKEEGALTLLAWEGAEVVGFVRLRISDEVEKELGSNTIELQRLYVHPYHQGKKIGSLLVERAIEHARRKNYEWIWLGVWEGNPQAQQFYSRHGFEKFGDHVFMMGTDRQIDLLFKLRLAG